MGNAGYSPVVESDKGLQVILGRDHPGFADPQYRRRRDEIAAVSAGWEAGRPVPAIEYTKVEHDVWRTVGQELAIKHRQHGCRAYVEATEMLDLPKDHVPQLEEVTARLEPLTGFRYLPVPGLAPLREFYGSFAGRSFFSTQYLRHHSVPLYTPEPDIIHEVVGHANQLAHPRFATIYEEVGKAVARTETSEALGFMSRVFWFTLEFGVVMEEGEPKAYGAGILSSFGELDTFQKAEIRPMNFAEMGTREYDITRYQPLLYMAGSFEALCGDLEDFFSNFDDNAFERLFSGPSPHPRLPAEL
ncbi:MAG TPA: phenylalanine 4-monooxygenase [Acidimicrobiales bacterium]|nr:phenylalanine 4-monooxygenase [Acidimicrobiales bacterium]